MLSNVSTPRPSAHPTKVQNVGIYITNTMADWEYAYLTTQIAEAEELKPGRFALQFVGDEPVCSMGGLKVAPTMTFEEAVALDCLVVPGAKTYASGHEQLERLTRKLVERGVPVAAICGATVFLGRNGFLDSRKHTSNAAEVLQVSGYSGEDHYVDAPAVSDQGVITAGAVHAVSFTAEIMRAIGLYSADMIDAWEKLYVTGKAENFYELMKATHAWQNS